MAIATPTAHDEEETPFLLALLFPWLPFHAIVSLSFPLVWSIFKIIFLPFLAFWLYFSLIHSSLRLSSPYLHSFLSLSSVINLASFSSSLLSFRSALPLPSHPFSTSNLPWPIFTWLFCPLFNSLIVSLFLHLGPTVLFFPFLLFLQLV